MLKKRNSKKTRIISAISLLLGEIVIFITNFGNIDFSFYQAITFTAPVGFSTELIIFAYVVNHDEIFRKINKKRLWKMIKESVIFFILAFILNIIENKNVLLMMSINSIFNIFSFLCIILLYFFIIFLLSCSFLYVFFVISLILYHYSIKYF